MLCNVIIITISVKLSFRMEQGGMRNLLDSELNQDIAEISGLDQQFFGIYLAGLPH